MTEKRMDERRHRRRLVLHERRTGFDRRTVACRGVACAVGGAVRTLRDRPRMLVLLLVELNLLNLCDYFLTRSALALGVVREENPLMRALFSTDARLAGVVKVLIVLGISMLVWRFRRYRRVLASSLVVVGLLLFVVVYQVWGWAVFVA